MKRGARALAAALCLLQAGCSISYRRCHASPLLEIWSGDAGAAARTAAPACEDAIVEMADAFGVALGDVIPIRAYIDVADTERRSYFNPITGAIVLRGRPGPSVFAHELSHLLARQQVLLVMFHFIKDAMDAIHGSLAAAGSNRPGGRVQAAAPAEVDRFLELLEVCGRKRS